MTGSGGGPVDRNLGSGREIMFKRSEQNGTDTATATDGHLI